VRKKAVCRRKMAAASVALLLAAAAAPLHTRAATMARLPLRVDVDFVSDTM